MKDLVGQRFGRLTVVAFSHRDTKNHYWKCLCDCGKEHVTRGARLRIGHCKSCGCFARDKSAELNFKHGNYANGNNNGSLTHHSWMGMIARCLNPKHPGYKHYGGRGIKVCERWMDYRNFLKDMGERPSQKHSIGRINNDGNYEPENCRWELGEQQGNNRRNNRIETFNGVTDTITRLARLNGFEPMRIITRLHSGWTVQEALSTPIMHRQLTA